ncbi:Nif3-like dinuclear metal center hexameric protein [Vulcanibacillus modesticaldus]|uniref:GTP cyclohydrolase 1 type 2 homolog n=1 Tax=Vulcanibacillus modesticaldus TaxID=337097 RepID=A0A1D2YVJ5_9BACI|nr:Nif3-like dinuclear metal center hexameric protein [Vulcanibacillus modesticaldus]OEF99739.1 Nif3-like dinuclear metal center hexameric protein [Vulcanibacillus modesticaldus]
MFGKGQNIIQILEQFAPKTLAYPEDKIGLQIGTLNKKIKRVMLTLDVLEDVVDEAIEKEVDLIISHHAIIYKPIKSLRTDLPTGRLYEKIIKNNIAVYVAHTNLDVTKNGVNDVLAQKIGIINPEVLEPSHIQKLKKIVVFVPESHQQQIIDALSNNGAGWIGNYSHCTFNVSGIGTFMPHEGTNPYIGEQGKLEKVKEVRVETIVPEINLTQAIQAMLKAHPYEEVAYDIYPLDLQSKKEGIGRIGKLEDTMSLKEYAEFVKKQLQVDGIRIIGDLNKKIRKVAVVGGDGNSFVSKAAFRGADVLVTGDIYYHVAHEALAQGLSIIDAGHYIEKHVLGGLEEYLTKEFLDRGLKTEVIISEVDTNPFQFL